MPHSRLVCRNGCIQKHFSVFHTTLLLLLKAFFITLYRNCCIKKAFPFQAERFSRLGFESRFIHVSHGLLGARATFGKAVAGGEFKVLFSQHISTYCHFLKVGSSDLACKPEIQVAKSIVFAKAGQNVTLGCFIRGSPVPDAKWVLRVS